MCVYYNIPSEIYSAVQCGGCPCETICSHSTEPMFEGTMEIIARCIEYGFETAEKVGLIYDE